MIEQLKSRYLSEFINEIQYKNRNPRELKALKLLDDKETNSVLLLSQKDKLFRCRIIKRSKKNEIGKQKGFFGFNEKDSFVAPPGQTRDMRANYRYIPYLYCSRQPYTALCEIRPRFGAEVSVATIGILETLYLLDFTTVKEKPRMTQAKMNLFSDLSTLFSVPITEDDETVDYVPTQFIAEYAKNLGYDGIVYKSSLIPEPKNRNPMFHNVVIFKYEKCYAEKSNVVTVKGCNMDFEQTDVDKKLEIISPIELELMKI